MEENASQMCCTVKERHSRAYPTSARTLARVYATTFKKSSNQRAQSSTGAGTREEMKGREDEKV